MGDERVKNEAMEVMGLFQLLPRLVVFDLDYTRWPLYCECRSKRDTPRMYPHAKGILYAFKDKGVKIAIASRSPTPDIGNTFLDKSGIQSIFIAQDRNINSVSKMGVTSILVGNGVNMGALREGLSKFAQKQFPSEKNKQDS
ncbi:hypothetical protein OROHE_002878 [Orobanche hederae]